MGCENFLDCDEVNFELLLFLEDVLNYYYVFLFRKINIFVYVFFKFEKIFFYLSKFYFNIGEVYVQCNYIKEYYVQNNFFYSLIGFMYGMEYVEYVDFFRNFVKNIFEFFFDIFLNFMYLDLSKNLLGNCLDEKV